MPEKENIAIAEQAIAAINARNIESILQRLDDSYVGESEIAPGPIRGRDGARKMLEMQFTAFPDLHLEVEQILASEDHVVIRARASATHKGNFAGIAPTNKRVNWQSCNVVEVRNGKVVRGRLYADYLSLFGQLGVINLPKAQAAG